MNAAGTLDKRGTMQRSGRAITSLSRGNLERESRRSPRGKSSLFQHACKTGRAGVLLMHCATAPFCNHCASKAKFSLQALGFQDTNPMSLWHAVRLRPLSGNSHSMS